MLANSRQFICSSFKESIIPFSQILETSLIPTYFQRKTDNSYIYCDTKQNTTTVIVQITYNSQGKIQRNIIQQFMGIYDYNCFGDQHAFLLNKQGDIAYYDFNTKDTFFIQRQHPSVYSSTQIHNIDQTFITCGGNVKKSSFQNQKIVKVWYPYEEQLLMKCRIITGHSKPIQNSCVLGRSRLATLSTDRTIRCINLATQQIQSVIPVAVDYYASCSLDWNTLIIGGIAKQLNIIDLRQRKLITTLPLSNQIIQITDICRLSASNLLMSNINHLLSLDLRTMNVIDCAEYSGERVSKIVPINSRDMVIGNRDRTMQIWRCA